MLNIIKLNDTYEELIKKKNNKINKISDKIIYTKY